MFNFLYSFNPDPIMFSWGFLKVYWYGFFIVLGFISAFLVVLFLSKKYKIEKNIIVDLAFYLFIFGIVGARLYDVLLEWRYYLKNPVDIFKIWQGGLAIHGAVLIGIIVILLFIKYKKIRNFENKDLVESFFIFSSIIVTGLSLGQAIGRWGNYFNQELFGRPTNLPWSIFINFSNRPLEYFSYSHFHPTFLYESIGCLLIFTLLFFLHVRFLKKGKVGLKYGFLLVSIYLVFYSVLRFFLEFIRVDFTPNFFFLRWPQFISILIILITISLFPKFYYKKN